MARKQKKMGCFTQIFWGIFVLLIFGVFAGSNNSEPSSPTATPAAVSQTEAPDYSSMSLTDAIKSVAEYADNLRCKTRECYAEGTNVYVEVDVNSLTTSSNITGAIMYCIDYAKNVFQNEGANKVYIRFHEPGRDSNGWEIDLTTMTMILSKQTKEKINLDYFYGQANKSAQMQFLKAIDGYLLHNDYKDHLENN